MIVCKLLVLDRNTLFHIIMQTRDYCYMIEIVSRGRMSAEAVEYTDCISAEG